jgi:GntR family transcriptional regulator
MEFMIQKNSPLPPLTQIKEQIKIALLLGNLRPGEILPSIRDLERELGISRNIVRKAYLELEELGILKLIHGKGVMVNKNLRYKKDKEFLDNCEQLAKETQKKCQSMGVVFSSFARYLYHKAIEAEQHQSPLIYVDISGELARERASQISGILNVKLEGLSIEELKKLKNIGKLRLDVKIVCNYYRLEEVRKILRGRAIDIVPLRMRLSEETKNELSRLPLGSKVVFIFDEEDETTLGLILEDYKRAFADHNLEFSSCSVKKVKAVVGRDGYAKLVVSNRIWNTIPNELRQAKNVTHPIMEFDPSSIEESKMELGVIA